MEAVKNVKLNSINKDSKMLRTISNSIYNGGRSGIGTTLKKCPSPNNELTIPEIFENCVKSYGDRIAVRCDEQQLTYKELNEKANLLANYLKKLGVDQNTVVAVYLDRSIELIISILAIVKAGGAYLPIDIHEPVNRIKIILQDSNAVKILTNNAAYKTLYCAVTSSAVKNVIKVDTFFNEKINEEIDSPAYKNTSTDLFYIMYTSGSTGTPKGCMISHRSVISLVKNTNYIQINPTDIIAQIANTAFDAMTFELWGALLNGAALHIIPQATLLSTPDFANTLKDKGISILLVTTSMLNLVVKKCPEAFDNLKYLLFGGEKANPEIIKLILNRKVSHNLSQLTIINAYGPTENTTIATTFKVENEADIKENVPIGRPIKNTEAFILDENLNPVQTGVIGELYLGGDGLALGYLNDIKQTSIKFIDCPWNRSQKIYKTGDLAYWQAGVGMIFVERADEQVKINGFRIELTEIEAMMIKRRAVKQAAVNVEINSEGRKELVAYVCFHEQPINYLEFYQYLKDNLPHYMLPKKIIHTDNILLTIKGKIDKKQLTQLKGKNILETVPKSVSANQVEEIIANVWQEKLGIPQINTIQNIFDLGANSLMLSETCILLNEKLESTGKKPINIVDILTYPTVQQLANYISSVDKNQFNVLKLPTERASFQRQRLMSRELAHAIK
jgi:amino acid adenylation domain-containing protein